MSLSRWRSVRTAAEGLVIGLAMAGGLSLLIRCRGSGDLPAPEDSARPVSGEQAPEVTAAIEEGRRYQAARQYDLARAAFVHAHALAPGDPEPVYGLGRLEIDLRRIPAAEQCFREALALDPGFVPALADLASIIGSMGRSGEAVGLLERAGRQAPENISIRMMLGQNLLREGQPQRAIEVLEGTLPLPGAAGQTNLFLLLGQAHLEAGHDEPARQALEQTLRIDPRLARAHLSLSRLLLKTGHPEEGQQEAAAFLGYRELEERIFDLTEALAARPDDEKLLLGLARAEVERGFPDRAAAPLRRALSLAPEDPAARELAGQIKQATTQAGGRPGG